MAPTGRRTFAPRLQMRDETLDRRSDADERAATSPCDQVDVRIALHKTGEGFDVSRGSERRQPCESGFGQACDHSGSMRFHGGTSTATKRRPNRCASALLPSSQLSDDLAHSAGARRAPSCARRRRVVAMRISVLDDRRSGHREPGGRDSVRRSAGITARATGTCAPLRSRASAATPPSRGRHRRRGTTRSARRPPRARRRARRRGLPSAAQAIRHGLPSALRACSAIRSATIAALRDAPSLSKSHVPNAHGFLPQSTAAARISGEYVRSSTTIARSNSPSRTPRARCSVSPLPVKGTTTGRAPLVTTSSTVL